MYDYVNDEYVGTLDEQDLPNFVFRMVEASYNYNMTNGSYSRWRRNYSVYNASDERSSYWNSYNNNYARTDYIPLSINHTKNIAKNTVMLALNQLPAFYSRSANSSPKVVDQIRIYNAILERDAAVGWMSNIITQAALQSFIMGTCFPFVEYDRFAGDNFMLDKPNGEKELTTTGDITADVLSVLDVFFDVTKKRFSDLDWIIVRQRANKYKLAKMFPDKADDIMSANMGDAIDAPYYFNNNTEFSDDIFIYKLIVKDDPILCPGGRYSILIAPNKLLADGANEYGIIPVFPLSPMPQSYGVYGDTDMNDMCQIQKFYDSISSCLMTKITAFGIDKIIVDNNSLIDTSSLTGGLKMFKMIPNSRPPVNMNLMGDLSGLTGLLPIAQKMLEDVSNMNSSSRGSPDPNIKAGVMVSMLQSMAQRYNSGFQKDIFRCMADMANFGLELRKKKCTFEQIIKIVGEDKKFEAKRWMRDDIALIDSVYVEPVDPVTNTIGGQIMYADKLAQMGADIPTYTRALKSGRYEPLIDPKQLEVNTAEMENSMIMKGEVPMVSIDDDPLIHGPIHKKVISDIDARKDPAIYNAYLQHKLEHDRMEIEQAKHKATVAAYMQQAQQQAVEQINGQPANMPMTEQQDNIEQIPGGGPSAGQANQNSVPMGVSPNGNNIGFK